VWKYIRFIIIKILKYFIFIPDKMSLEVNEWTIERKINPEEHIPDYATSLGKNQGKTIIRGTDINLLFPDWESDKEVVIFATPHDDDPIFKAYFAMLMATENGAKVYIVQATDGSLGFTEVELEDKIVGIRKRETDNSARDLVEEMIRFNLPDACLGNYSGARTINGEDALSVLYAKAYKQLGATRVVVPTWLDDHTDHFYLNKAAILARHFANDGLLPAHYTPTNIRSILEYFVYNEPTVINEPNIAIIAPSDKFDAKLKAVAQFKSQKQVAALVESIRIDGPGEIYRELPAQWNNFREQYKKFFWPE
jgi:LmbE family N-acetylglucosaminyl deacetylase